MRLTPPRVPDILETMLLPFLFLLSHSVHAEGLAPGTPVVLVQGFPQYDAGAKDQPCKQLTPGAKGIVRKNYFSDDATAYVEWVSLGKNCSPYDRTNFVSTSAVKATGPAPSGSKAPKPCRPVRIDTSEEARQQQEFFAESTQQKSDAEVDTWLRCYPSKNYQNYIDQYAQMIDWAADLYSVDSAMLKCLLNRESQWDAKMISCTCATGLGQQTMGNQDDIGSQVGMPGNRPNSRMARVWEKYMQMVDAKYGLKKLGCSGGFQRSNELPKDSAAFKELASHAEPGCAKAVGSCRIFAQDDRRCPAASIAAAAAYLRSVNTMVRDSLNCGQIADWQINDMRIAFALTYNAGQKTAMDALAKADVNNLMSLEILDKADVKGNKRGEMRGHFMAIRNCLQKNNTSPPAKGDPDRSSCITRTREANAAPGAAGTSH